METKTEQVEQVERNAQNAEARRRRVTTELLQAGYDALSKAWARRLASKPKCHALTLAELSNARDWGTAVISAADDTR